MSYASAEANQELSNRSHFTNTKSAFSPQGPTKKVALLIAKLASGEIKSRQATYLELKLRSGLRKMNNNKFIKVCEYRAFRSKECSSVAE